MCSVRNIQSTMLRQISSVVEDEVSELTEPDVISSSPQPQQLEYVCRVFVLLIVWYYQFTFLLTFL